MIIPKRSSKPKSTSFSDVLVAIALLSLIVAAVMALAIRLQQVNSREAKENPMIAPGEFATVKRTNQKVVMVSWDQSMYPCPALCRIDNGEGTSPRYEEVRFAVNELEPLTPTVEK